MDLLRANPGTQETIEVKIKSGTTHGKVRYKVFKREVQVGGYWSKFNTSRGISHFWIYTRVRLATGQWKVVEVINYDRWLKIMETYFLIARKHIISGEALNLTSRLGYIEPRHIERSHENKQVNFPETARQPKVWDPVAEKMKAAIVIYHTDDTYARIAWRKLKQLPGERSYEFIPCHGDKEGNGFKQQFSQANKQNPALKTTYPYYPRVLPTQANTA